MVDVEVLVVGGGATGAGILRDLAMRNIPAMLIEQGGIAAGTSSRFHGLLHSGARYAVRDLESAKECIEENLILKRVASECVELTSGIFVLHKSDDESYLPKWLDSCKNAGIETNEIKLSKLYQLERNLSKDIVAAYEVPDSCVDGFRLVWHNLEAAKRNGAKALTYHKLIEIKSKGGKVSGATAINLINNEKVEINCRFIINASGSWSGEVASIAGLSLPISPDKGTLIVFNNRYTSRVINRLHSPGDADIFVPHGTVTILGTTSSKAEAPNDNIPTKEEVETLLRIGKDIFPEIYNYRILRAFAGTRPLYNASGEGRSASRNFSIVNHKYDGVEGLISIFGGKLTTYRLMAEKVTDLVCKNLGTSAKCRTAVEPIVSKQKALTLKKAKKFFSTDSLKLVSSRLGYALESVVNALDANKGSQKLLCDCEMVTLAEIEEVSKDDSTHSLHDIRFRTRLGMGTCQGTFCGIRTLLFLFEKHLTSNSNNYDSIATFLQERWRGIYALLWGKQLREAELMRAIYLSTFNIDNKDTEIW